MIMLRLMKKLMPYDYKSMFPPYSIEMYVVASDPQIFSQWAENNKYTAQIFLDKHFNGDASQVEGLRQIVLRSLNSPKGMSQVR